MKTIFTAIISIVIFSANAQQISNWKTSPQNPTNNDSIELIVESWFPSGSCDLFMYNVSQTGQNIDVNFTHCLGMLTVICNSSDTFQLGKLNAGSYNLSMFLYSGSLFGPTGCSATLSNVNTGVITVTQSVGINEINSSGFLLVNENNEASISLPAGTKSASLSIYDLSGRKVITESISNENHKIDLLKLNKGSYFYDVICGNGNILKGKFIIR